MQTQRIYLCYKILTLHSDYFPKQLTACYNIVALCCCKTRTEIYSVQNVNDKDYFSLTLLVPFHTRLHLHATLYKRTIWRSLETFTWNNVPLNRRSLDIVGRSRCIIVYNVLILMAINVEMGFIFTVTPCNSILYLLSLRVIPFYIYCHSV